MTYDTRERSVHDGSPVELFEFERLGTIYRYTSQAVDFNLSGVIYTAIPLRRGDVEATQDIERVAIRIELPRDAGVAESFIQIPPTNVMLLTVRRVHRADTDAVVVWMGRVLNAEWRAAEVTLTCEPVFTSLRRNALRRLYGRNCPHALYDQACRASSADHRIDGTVASITGSTVEIAAAAAAPANSLDGGFASWTAPGGANEQRMILSHSGSNVDLIAPPFGLTVGAAIQVHDGCEHTMADCGTRFANTDNYGGFPNIPLRNPFDSSGPTY